MKYKEIQFSEYTKNMYKSNKSTIWTKFNLIRINIVLYLLKTLNTKGADILEIGAYDLFFIDYSFNKGLFNDVNSIDLSDLYNSIDKQIVAYTKNNFEILKNKYKNIKFNLLTQSLEKIEEFKKYDYIFIFETLEHVQDEKKCIKNISKIVKKGGRVFVSIPIEHGFLFFIKDLGRRLLLGNKSHTYKELFFGLIGKPDKIKRVIGGHKGYDYRITKKLFKENGFKLKKQKTYPLNFCFFGYGTVLEYEKL